MSEQKHTYVALLRAVNVGGTGKLAMTDLKAMCEGVKLERVRTYIASGNVVFITHLTQAQVVVALEATLLKHMGKPVGVVVRSAAELEAIAANNPFSGAPGNRVVALCLPKRPNSSDIANVTGQRDEVLALGTREIYVHYVAGIAESKLKLPISRVGTARNMNTIIKLAAMCADGD
jgi:uncharacterized protein (DUF1697 family)